MPDEMEFHPEDRAGNENGNLLYIAMLDNFVSETGLTSRKGLNCRACSAGQRLATTFTARGWMGASCELVCDPWL